MISNTTTPKGEVKTHTVVIVGGGAAGISVAASIHKRDRDIGIAIIEPASTHHYQPGWTMVVGGVFRPEVTSKPMPIKCAGVGSLHREIRHRRELPEHPGCR